MVKRLTHEEIHALCTARCAECGNFTYPDMLYIMGDLPPGGVCNVCVMVHNLKKRIKKIEGIS